MSRSARVAMSSTSTLFIKYSTNKLTILEVLILSLIIVEDETYIQLIRDTQLFKFKSADTVIIQTNYLDENRVNIKLLDYQHNRFEIPVDNLYRTHSMNNNNGNYNKDQSKLKVRVKQDSSSGNLHNN